MQLLSSNKLPRIVWPAALPTCLIDDISCYAVMTALAVLLEPGKAESGFNASPLSVSSAILWVQSATLQQAI